MPSKNTIRRIVEFAARLEGIDPRVLQEGLAVLHLHHQIEQRIENDLAHWGVTARQFEIMEALYHNPEGTMTAAALADEVGLTRSAMTSVLDGLGEQGHTLRTRHATDRRMVVISLTPCGREFMHAALPERYRQFHRVMASLSARERTLLLQTCKKVLELQTHEFAGAVPAEAAACPPEPSGKEGSQPSVAAR
jgi:DNA-binding MarR family transcriptional regulator